MVGPGGGEYGATDRSGSWLRTVRTLVPVVAVLLAGCLGGANQPATERSATPEATLTTNKPPAGLDSVLYQLANADDRSSFAAAHGLRLRNGQVLVVIELVADGELPDEFDIDVRSRHGTLVQAYVDIDDLVALVGSEPVVAVRAPDEVVTHDTDS